MLEVTDELYQEFKKFHDYDLTKLRMFRSYGTHKLVNQYLGLPSWFPIDYITYLEHGISYNEGEASAVADKRLAEIGPECILLNNKMRADGCKAVYQKDSYILGASFVHYRNMHQIEQDEDAKGTLVFPSHSSPYAYAVFDYEAYAEALLNLPEKYHPIHVCVYWMDILLGQHEPFVKHNIPVYTCGHLGDAKFAHNFYNLIKRYKYLSSNHVGSYAVYSLEMGIPFILYGGGSKGVASEKGGDSEMNTKTANTIMEGKVYKSIEAAFRYTDEMLEATEPVITEEQWEQYHKFIDKENWDSKDEIRSYLIKNAIPIFIKKVFFAIKKRFFSSKKQLN